MADKPRFDPSKPFEAAGATSKPKFDPSKPFNEPTVDDSIPALPGTPERARQMKNERPLSDAGESFFDEAGRVVKSVVGPATKGLAAVGEMGLSGLTGVAGSAANLVNAVSGAKELPGMKQPGESDADFYKRTREAATYQPRTEGGKELANSVIPQGIGHVVEEGGKGFERITGSPAAGELFKDAFAVGTAAAPMMGKGPVRTRFPTPEDNAAAKSAGTVTSKISETPVDSLRAAGIKVRPSDVKGLNPETKNGIASAAEKFAGSDASSSSLSLKNQVLLTRFALDEIGAPKNAKAITPGVLGESRQPHLATYRKAGNAVGEFEPSPEYHSAIDSISAQKGLSPAARRTIRKDLEQYRNAKTTGPDVVKTISALRRKASQARKSTDVDMQSRGDAYKQAADALETEFDRQVTARGDAGLVGELKSARESLAKINDVEEATTAGQIDAAALKRRRDQKGAPLSGKLAIIADAAEHAPGVTRHSLNVSKPVFDPSSLVSTGADIATLGLRPAVRAIMESKLYQNRLGKQAAEIGPGEGLSDYFPTPTPEPASPKAPTPIDLPPTPSSSMLQAQKMAGDLSLADDIVNPESLPEAPSRLQAETPPPVRGGLPFRSTNPTEFLPDDLLEFAPEVETGRIPGGQNPRAPGMSQEVPGTILYPELRAVRGRPDEVAGELALADDIVGPQQSPGGGSGNAPPTGPVGNPGLDLAADLGIEVVPSAKKPGFFEVRINGQEAPVAFRTAEEAQAASLSIADELLGGLPEEPPLSMADDIFENNASGESAASVEAINRVSAEKAAGQDRFLIDQNGTVTPLKGVDSVDAVARPGQVIAQRGIGASPYSVLDRGGLSKRAAENRINMVLDLLGDRE